ncbi:MAG: CapA family protein, partial [Clostridia bacterium]|nr:CapA family protein [Clostridia bacterium]
MQRRSIRFFALLLLGVLALTGALASGCDFSGVNPLESSAPAVSGDVSGSVSAGPSEISLIDLPDESPEESPEPEPQVLHFMCCGDNLIHPSVYFTSMEYYAAAHGTTTDYVTTHEAGYDFAPIYEYFAEDMAAADYLYINQETLSGGPGTTIDGYPSFNSPEAIHETMAALGADIVNLAHNHMLDSRDDRYLVYTDALIRSLGPQTIGYYRNFEDTNNIVVTEKNGIRVAWLSYVYATNYHNTDANNYVKNSYIPYFSQELCTRQVALAKQQADVVIVSAHWGNEYSFKPNSFQETYAQLLCELGVDVIVGMHPHCLQPMEWRTNSAGHRTLLTYSLGNFVSGMQEAQCVLEGVLSFDVRKETDGTVTVENPLMTPIVCHYVKGKVVNSKLDTGYREFKLYRLKDYTEDLAAVHGVHYYEKRKSSATLYDSETGRLGAKFSIANMIYTVKKLIPSEFLPPE